MSNARNAHTYLGAKYRRIAARRGPVKAIVAVQHAILIAIWNMGATGTLYDDPEQTSTTRLHPDKPDTAPSTSSNTWQAPFQAPASVVHRPGYGAARGAEDL
jgi:hypothetical protein